MKPPLKQYFFKRLVCIALAIVLFSGFVPLKTEAADKKYAYKIINLKQNTNATIKDYYWDRNTFTTCLYKITVPANGYITIQTNGSSSSFRIYKTIKRNKPIYESENMAFCSGKKSYLVLPKGVYYIYSADEGKKIKWNFTKSKNPKNFCMVKAKTLAPKKKIKLVFNHKYEFARWYKIKLAKRKTITLTLKGLDGSSYNDFEIFDSQRQEINCPRLTDTSYRTETLPKGTYYIRIDGGRYYDEWSGRIYQIMWK